MKNLLFAARPLLSDFLSTLVFVVLVALKIDLRLAVGSAMAVGVAQVAIMRFVFKHPVPLLQWASLGLVLVFGATSLFTHDPRFLMVKPTIIYLTVATVMMKRGWMLRYLPPEAQRHGASMMVIFGYIWAGLMALTAGLNLIVAVWFTKDWPAFIAIFPMASKIGLFAIHFLTVRAYVKRRIVAEAQVPVQAQAA